nr:hypothetical protein [Marinicella sp. W31]MDC2878507.1 hypothetical protein [Marinicella sp. W31]
MNLLKLLKLTLILPLVLLLSGCQLILLDPAGWVANQERDLLIASTVLMLVIIVPVLVLAVYIPGGIATAARPRKTTTRNSSTRRCSKRLSGACRS